MTPNQPTAPTVTGTRAAVLAISLLALELLGGMQVYLLNTVIPVVGADLNAQDFYGLIFGTVQVAVFLTIPLGPWLLERFRVNHLLLALTWLTITGAVTSALAPNIYVFLTGRAITGLAAGALATVSLAAIVTVLPAAWRRAVLAGYNVTWVLASLAGPLYAGWITTTLSWRWALVGYLPLLLIVRYIAARQLRGTMQTGSRRERLRLGPAVVLASGVAILAIGGLRSVGTPLAVMGAALGVVVILLSARALLPVGTLSARPGRPAALTTMGAITGAYLGAHAIIAIVVFDVLGGTTAQVAVVLGASGLGWAFAGLYVSRWPTAPGSAYRRRVSGGVVLIATGCLAIAAAVWMPGLLDPIVLVGIGWSVAGIGIGLSYLDTLNAIVDADPANDGVSVAQAASAAVLIEAIASAMTETLASASLGRAVAAGSGQQTALVILVAMAALAMWGIWASRRVRA